MNDTLTESTTYRYSMIIGPICIGLCFIGLLGVILNRTISECDKRERQMRRLHRFMNNLSKIASDKSKDKCLSLDYDGMIIMLEKRIHEMDEIKRQLQLLSVTVAEKIGKLTKKNQIEYLQRAIIDNQVQL